MGEVELNKSSQQIIIHSVFYFYGDAATAVLSNQIAEDIQTHWNEPVMDIVIKGLSYHVRFNIQGIYEPELAPEIVWYNDNPRNNYFRIEEFSGLHISFTDGLSCNTGYFKLDNLLNNSTTAAHEYGHTLGLDHPSNLDIRGQGQPGIMYPRGTVCDPEFHYDYHAVAGAKGGTLNPYTRKVMPPDIEALRLQRLSFKNGFASLGDFSSVYHDKHLPEPAIL
jgi:hypothetical protein